MDVSARRVLLIIAAALCFLAAVGVDPKEVELFPLGAALGFLGLSL